MSFDSSWSPVHKFRATGGLKKLPVASPWSPLIHVSIQAAEASKETTGGEFRVHRAPIRLL